MSIVPTHTDDELLSLLRKGEVAAFEIIYNQYWSKLYNYAYKRLNNSEVCEETIQEVFTKLWQKRHTINIKAGLDNYLFTAVKYNIVDHYRRQLLQENYFKYNALNNQTDNSTEENIFLHDLQKKIDEVINQLPEKCRHVYQLSRLEQKTNKEIAQILQISEKTVEGHITKALQQLRLELSHFLPLLIILLIN